jgi:hypothetical protein
VPSEAAKHATESDRRRLDQGIYLNREQDMTMPSKWRSRTHLSRLPSWTPFVIQTVLFTMSMATVMSIVLTLIRSGPIDGWTALAFGNAVTAFPIAFCASLMIGPIVRKTVAYIVRRMELSGEPCELSSPAQDP